MSGMIKYAFKDGENVIGKKNEENPPDVQLNGVGIDVKHCTFEFSKGEESVCNIIPNEQPSVYSVKVNGDLLEETRELKHGDRILVGSHHYYIFVDPTIDNDL